MFPNVSASHTTGEGVLVAEAHVAIWVRSEIASIALDVVCGIPPAPMVWPVEAPSGWCARRVARRDLPMVFLGHC